MKGHFVKRNGLFFNTQPKERYTKPCSNFKPVSCILKAKARSNVLAFFK